MFFIYFGAYIGVREPPETFGESFGAIFMPFYGRETTIRVREKFFLLDDIGCGKSFFFLVNVGGGAGGIYFFWCGDLGCGRHLFMPTSK